MIRKYVQGHGADLRAADTSHAPEAQGGWTTAKLLLDVHGHFLPRSTPATPTPLQGLLAHPIRTLRLWFRPTPETTDPQVLRVERVLGYPPSEMTPRSPIVHFDVRRPRNPFWISCLRHLLPAGFSAVFAQ